MSRDRDFSTEYAAESVRVAMDATAHPTWPTPAAGADPVELGDAEILAAIHRYVAPAMTAGPLPEFGSARWAALDDDDPAKAHAVIRAALAHHNQQLTEDEAHVQVSRDLSAAMTAQGVRVGPPHAELARRRGVLLEKTPARTAAQIAAQAAYSWRALEREIARQQNTKNNGSHHGATTRVAA